MREREYLAKIRCPKCGRHLSLNRYGGPQSAVHYPGGNRRLGAACRIVGNPDPHAPDFSERHRVYDVDEVASQRGLDSLQVEDFADELTEQWEAEFGVGAHIRARAAS